MHNEDVYGCIRWDLKKKIKRDFNPGSSVNKSTSLSWTLERIFPNRQTALELGIMAFPSLTLEGTNAEHSDCWKRRQIYFGYFYLSSTKLGIITQFNSLCVKMNSQDLKIRINLVPIISFNYLVVSHCRVTALPLQKLFACNFP